MTREEMLDQAVALALSMGHRGAFTATPAGLVYHAPTLRQIAPFIRHRFAQIAAIEGLRGREAAR